MLVFWSIMSSGEFEVIGHLVFGWQYNIDISVMVACVGNNLGLHPLGFLSFTLFLLYWFLLCSKSIVQGAGWGHAVNRWAAGAGLADLLLDESWPSCSLPGAVHCRCSHESAARFFSLWPRCLRFCPCWFGCCQIDAILVRNTYPKWWRLYAVFYGTPLPKRTDILK